MTTTQEPPAELAAAMEFMGRAVGDFGGFAAVALWSLADELGLLTALSEGPATAARVTAACDVDVRSAEEILAGLAAAGYLTRAGDEFTLPPAQAAVVVDGTPMSAAGGAAEIGAMLRMWPQIVAAAKNGTGIDPLSYPRQFHDGMERLNRPIYTGGFPQEGVDLIEGLRERLEAGATVADVGAGTGLALIGLAQAFPALRGVGYDLDPHSLAAARANAQAARVADRIRFEQRDVADGVGDSFDVVLAFDLLHDTGDPAAVATGLRRATKDDGLLVVLEPAAGDDPAADVGPMAALMRLFSVGYCLPVATHHGSARLGTAGLPPGKLESLLRDAGYSHFEQVAWQAGFNAAYAARPAPGSSRTEDFVSPGHPQR